MNDTGYYRCKAIFKDQTQIMGSTVQIAVSVQPSTYLTVTGDGSPVCGAIGGNPPAEISWIPHSDDINSTVVEEPDQKWSVISTLKSKEISETSVTCVVSHPTLQNAWKEAIALRVQPSTFLTVTSDGSPVCGAIGGNPPAEISWIPHSDNVKTTVVKEPDQTWSVISTLRRKGMNETSVTCVVSHPTLENPWKGAIILSDYRLRCDNNVRIIITVMATVLMAGLLLYLGKIFHKKKLPNTDEIQNIIAAKDPNTQEVVDV
ncbi:nectin-3-like [Dendropsophus ebraccatus]|uniref:nectin-3-like n=1 Tax=Dendropsophus ebraccatus TaxID=150705 RepID=UPI0038318C7A